MCKNAFYFKNFWCFLYSDNLVVVTPINKNWVPSDSLSREESKYFLRHPCTLVFSYVMSVCLQAIKKSHLFSFFAHFMAS